MTTATADVKFSPHLQAYISDEIAAGQTDPGTILHNAINRCNERLAEILRAAEHRLDGTTGNVVASPVRKAIHEAIAAQVYNDIRAD